MDMSSELSEHARNPRDAFNFAPSNISPQTLPRTRDLTRHRFSIAGFDHLMRSQRNEFDSSTHPHSTFSELETCHDANDRPTKRRQRSSKSFSSIKPANLHCLKASYQAVKANAKQKFQTVGLYKRRATSHDTSERPVLQRPRSLFGLRPSTSGIASKMAEEKQEDTSHGLNPLLQENPTPWSQLSGAAARQSAREFGKAPISSRPRDDSAFGEHRVQQNDNRESGISLVTELENLHIDDASQLVPVLGIYRYDPFQYLPAEVAAVVLSYLQIKDLIVCEHVSRRWRKLSKDPCVRRQRFLNDWTKLKRENTLTTPVGGLGIGIPNFLNQNWTQMHLARQALEKRWHQGPINKQVTATYLTGHTDSVYCVQFDERKIITGSRDRTFRVWDIKTGELRLTVGVPLAFDNDRRVGPRISSQESLTGPMQVINRPSSTYGKYMVPHFYHNASILCLQFDHELLVTGSSDHSLIMWDVKTFQPVRRLSQHSAGVLDIAFDEVKIVSCSKDGTICVWDRRHGSLLAVLVGHKGPVNAVQMHGDRIVTASGEGCAKLWQLKQRALGTEFAQVEGRCIKEFKSKDRGLACVEFSSDGRFVMAGGNDKVIYKFDCRTGAQVEVYEGHKGLVRSVYLDQLNRRVVTGSYDNELKCWDYEIDNTGNSVRAERWGLTKWAMSWILSAKCDYRRLVTTSQDGRALLLDFGAGIEGVDSLAGS